MPACCNARGCDQFFDRRFARRVANRYRRRGLDRTSRRIVAFLEERGLAGATVLEVGGGVGEIQLELLKRGALRTVNLELSPGYDEEARRLLREAGFEGRAERRLTDIATQPDEVGPADVVVLNRVVCCYPDYERLLAAVADHARRLVVFSYPPRNLVSRAIAGAENLLSRVRGRDFRVFTHPPAAMHAVLEERGVRRAAAHSALVWRVAGLERTT
jgi:magnesium-protoporphyrin O-methyltransferase